MPVLAFFSACFSLWLTIIRPLRNMGKQEHMASAAEELLAKPALGVSDVSKSTTLLIDDDPKNIRMSLKDGTRAIWFNPREPNDLLDNILLLK